MRSAATEKGNIALQAIFNPGANAGEDNDDEEEEGDNDVEVDADDVAQMTEAQAAEAMQALLQEAATLPAVEVI